MILSLMSCCKVYLKPRSLGGKKEYELESTCWLITKVILLKLDRNGEGSFFLSENLLRDCNISDQIIVKEFSQV